MAVVNTRPQPFYHIVKVTLLNRSSNMRSGTPCVWLRKSGEDESPSWTALQLLIPAAGGLSNNYSKDAEQVARALLGRFTPGDHVAIWSPNCPEWVLLEFGAALAGITLVTANPAYLAKELVHVLKQSKAHGIVICPEYCGRDFRAVLRQIAADVPNLREVIGLSDWSDFLKSGETSRAALLPPTIEPELSSRI